MIRIRPIHRRLHALLDDSDRVFVAECLDPRGGFPASRVSPVSVAALGPRELAELRWRVGARLMALELGEVTPCE